MTYLKVDEFSCAGRGAAAGQHIPQDGELAGGGHQQVAGGRAGGQGGGRCRQVAQLHHLQIGALLTAPTLQKHHNVIQEISTGTYLI